MREWKLADAKNRFSEVVEAAMSKGPQIVTRSSRKVVVIVDYEEFRKSPPPHRQALAVHLLRIPPADHSEPELERLALKPRKVRW